MKFTDILAIASIIPSSLAWNVIYYSQPRCKGDVITFENITNEDGICHQPTPMNVEPLSAMVTNLFEHGFYYSFGKGRKSIRFFDSSDCFSTCHHRHVLGDSDWGDCVSWPHATKAGQKMQSFKIEELGDIGMGNELGAVSDGICRLKHGDKLFFRNQYWRMQQVAAAWFKEIPEEEWDPSVHTQNTTVRFGQHGDVDAFGKYKLSEEWDGYTDKITLEFWDDEKHNNLGSHHYYGNVNEPEFYDNLVDGLCEDATRDDLNRDLLLSKLPNVDDLCNGWKNGVKGYIPMEEQATFSDFFGFISDEEMVDELK